MKTLNLTKFDFSDLLGTDFVDAPKHVKDYVKWLCEFRKRPSIKDLRKRALSIAQTAKANHCGAVILADIPDFFSAVLFETFLHSGMRIYYVYNGELIKMP